MALVDQYHIPEDQYDDGRMKGQKRFHQIRAHLAQTSDERLRSIFTDFWTPQGGFNYERPEFREFVRECVDPDQPMNLTTLMLMVGRAAYERDVLDEDDWIDLQD